MARSVMGLGALVTLSARDAAAQQAGTGVVTGRVTGPDGHAIANASVAVSAAPAGAAAATTDRGGLFRLAAVPVGRHTVTVRALGMRPASRVVTVGADEPARLAVALEVGALLRRDRGATRAAPGAGRGGRARARSVASAAARMRSPGTRGARTGREEERQLRRQPQPDVESVHARCPPDAASTRHTRRRWDDPGADGTPA